MDKDSGPASMEEFDDTDDVVWLLTDSQMAAFVEIMRDPAKRMAVWREARRRACEELIAKGVTPAGAEPPAVKEQAR